MKTIDWRAVRDATPTNATCNHCRRPDIVVNKISGLLFEHYTEPKQMPGRKARRPRVKCAGSNQLYTSNPGGET